MKGIVISVDYGDLLSITLPRNMRHLDSCLVITTPGDSETQKIAAAVPRVEILTTDVFYANGAKFNKGAAMEAGFDRIGRDGWILIWDADTLFPDWMPLDGIDPECLHNAPRRILQDPRQWHPGFDWRLAPPTIDRVHPGYFQLFHAGAEALKGRKDWYEPTYTHCGGTDYFFECHWPSAQRRKFEWHVLHLGPRDSNWCGRQSVRLDGILPEGAEARKQDMEEFLAYKGWGRPKSGRSFREHTDNRQQPETY